MSPNLILYVCTSSHGLVPPATRVERKRRRLSKPCREEQCSPLAALQCPCLPGEAARSLPSAPVTEGRDRPVHEVQPCTQYQPQELFIVPQEVTGDVDVNGREIQTRCLRALSKGAHINVQHSSPSELPCVKPLWLPKDQCDSVEPALEQGKGFLLIN